MDGYDLSKVPKEDLEYAKKQGTGILKELIYLFKKFNNITHFVKAMGRLFKWNSSDTTKLKVIEEKNAFKINLRLSLLSYCLSAPTMGVAGLLYIAAGYLFGVAALDSENLNFMSDKENKENHKFILDAYNDYIAVLEDLVKQAKQKGETTHEKKFQNALSHLEKGRDRHLNSSKYV